jgi:hypothetical protein
MEKLKGGLSDKKTLTDVAKKHDKKGHYHIDDMIEYLKKELQKGIKIEMEHTNDKLKAKEIAMDHLYEDPNYYKKLNKIEIGEKWSEKYKKSIDCNNPKGFSQRAHCQGRKKKSVKEYELEKGSEKKFNPPPHETETYKKLMKGQREEQTMAGSSGSFEPALSAPIVKRKINKLHNMPENKIEATEQTAVGAGGGGFGFDVPLFGKTPKGRKDPLKIEGPKSIQKSRAVTDKKFPKWGGPGGVFIKVKEKCKKFPYCNQGDINAIEPLRESIKEISKKHGIPVSEVEKIVLNEIKRIFI